LGLDLDSAEKAHALNYAPRSWHGAHAVSIQGNPQATNSGREP
jgi:hypothetical protein